MTANWTLAGQTKSRHRSACQDSRWFVLGSSNHYWSVDNSLFWSYLSLDLGKDRVTVLGWYFKAYDLWASSKRKSPHPPYCWWFPWNAAILSDQQRAECRDYNHNSNLVQHANPSERGGGVNNCWIRWQLIEIQARSFMLCRLEAQGCGVANAKIDLSVLIVCLVRNG